MKKFTSLVILLISCILGSYGQGSWSQSNLSTSCIRPGKASYGSKIYIAGGARGANVIPSTVIDIYDVNSKQWSTSNLSVAREFTSGVGSGGKLIFAGGVNFANGTVYSVVDILDTTTGLWTTEQLSVARFGMAVVSEGDEVIFAGGSTAITSTGVSDVVDIYNSSTGVWSTTTLSQPRAAMGYAVAGNKAIIAGGFSVNGLSNVVDIYNFTSGVWTTDTLSLARAFLSAAAADNKILIGGGVISTTTNASTDRVDIYDVNTGTWTTSSLSVPRCFSDYAVSVCDKAIFAGGGNFDFPNLSWTSASDIVDVYDPATQTWSFEQIPSHACVNHCVVANGIQMFIAGGIDMTGNPPYSTVDIYTDSSCFPTTINELQNDGGLFTVYPNPVHNNFTIELSKINSQMEAVITDITGKVIYKTITTNSGKIVVNTSNFDNGIYLVQVQTENFTETRKIIVAK